MYLRINYEKYLSKRHDNVLAIFLAEILDKIYFVKIWLFSKKFDNGGIQVTLYFIYHLLLLSLLCAFFTVGVIKKIFEETNYPGMNFYLSYGFISNIIVWIIYKLFLMFLDVQDQVRNLAIMKINLKTKANNNLVYLLLKLRFNEKIKIIKNNIKEALKIIY